MTTYTNILKLAKPEYADAVNVAAINSNMDKIDAHTNVVIGIPTTLANTPDGQLMLDETQDCLCIKVDGELIHFAPRLKARGKITSTTLNTSSATFTNSILVSGLQATFNAEVGRKYLVDTIYSLRWVSGSTSPGQLFIATSFRWAQAAVIDQNSTLLFGVNNNIVGGIGVDRTFRRAFEFFPNVNAQVTVGITFENTSTVKVAQLYAGALGRTSRILVKDYGA